MPRSVGTQFQGNSPLISLKNHLKKAHPSEFQEFLLKEGQLKAKTAEKAVTKSKKRGRQLTLDESLQMKPEYDNRGSDRYKIITKKLAVFVGATNMPNSIVENPEFRALLKVCDPRYPLPGRAAVRKEIDLVLVEVKGKIQGSLSSANKINLCADIWTKKGMSSSNLGVSAHFFSRKDHKRHIATIAVRKMNREHSGDNIRALMEEILREWDIPTTKMDNNDRQW